MRYIKLYAHFLRFSFSKAMEFRMNFFFRVFMDIIYYAFSIAFYKVLYLHTNSLAGWNESQMMVFVASFLFVDAMFMTIFANNMWWFPFYVNRGDLDYYLTRPVSSLFFLSLREFAADSFINLLMSIGIMFWAFSMYEEPIAIGKFMLYLVLLFNGILLLYLMRVIMLIPVIWLHSDKGLHQIFLTIEHSMERPDGIFQGWTRRFLMTVMPFSLMASFPVQVLFNQNYAYYVIHILSVTAFFTLFAWAFWKFGLRSYSSASS